jgi:hypothetical protein
VPIYELACDGGHRSETLQPSTHKVPSGVAGTAERRPVLAHEGRFEGSPPRTGDPAPPRPTGTGGAAGEGSAT